MNFASQIITQPQYAFLQDNSDLAHCLYLTLSGSHGYGTSTPSSDVDLRGVLAEPARCLYGLSSFEQFEDRETDTVIYGLRKYITLCVNANPNALELLGTEEDSIAYITEAGQLLKDNAGLFLTQRVISSFGNYATAQLRRLTNALCHDHYSAAEQEHYLCQTLNGQLSHFNSVYTPLGKGGMEMYLDEENQLLFDVNLKGYPVRDFVGIYSEMNSTLKVYSKLNHRGRKKDDAHLYKHAMHLIRLLITGTDILAGKGILTKRRLEHDLLMDIRNGKYSYEEITALSDEYRAKFEAAAKATQLPKEPDITAVEKLMQQIYTKAGLIL